MHEPRLHPGYGAGFQDPESRALRSRAAAAIRMQWRGAKECPICTQITWSVGDMGELRQYAGGHLVHGGGQVTPVVPMVCLTCGFTHFFNALVLGIVREITAFSNVVGPILPADEESRDQQS
jgi:hypothetical protein